MPLFEMMMEPVDKKAVRIEENKNGYAKFMRSPPGFEAEILCIL
jgi:hypothetical protein